MRNSILKFLWLLFLPFIVCIFLCSCSATDNTGTQMAGGGSGTTGTVGQNTDTNPIMTPGASDSSSVISQGQPTAQQGAQVNVQQPTQQPNGQTVSVGPGGSGGSPPIATTIDSGTLDGNTTTVAPQDTETETPVTTVQPVGDGQTCLNPGDGTYAEPGPYKIKRDTGIDLGSLLPGVPAPTTFAIWYPDPLETNCLHPIVSWGNGTTVVGPDIYDFFNRNAAAWGMVVIGSDNSNVGSGAYQKAGIDYLLQQNDDPSSKFYQKLSTKAGTSGHSQGGMGATIASSHPNVIAEACVAGGGLVEAKVAFLCLTGTADMVNAMCTATYNAAPGPAFIADWEGGDHVVTETLAGYIIRDPGSLAMQRLYAAWFRCFLADDPVACGMFKGNPCGICNEPGWANIGNRNM